MQRTARPHRRPHPQQEHHEDNRHSTEAQRHRVESQAGGGVGDTCLTHGRHRREGEGNQDRTHGPGDADGQRTHDSQRREFLGAEPQGRQCPVRVHLDTGLAAERLRHYRQSGDPGEYRQHPPSDGLRMDRVGGQGIQLRDVGGAGTTDGPKIGIEAWQVRHPVAQAHDVDVEDRRLGVHDTCERRGGDDVVALDPDRGEVVLGRLDPHDAKEDRRASGRGGGVGDDARRL